MRTLQPQLLEMPAYGICYKEKATVLLEWTVGTVQKTVHTQRQRWPCRIQQVMYICYHDFLLYKEGVEPPEKDLECCSVLSVCLYSQAQEFHYLYLRGMFCFLPCQLHLQFCNFSFQQVDHFLIVLLCTVRLSLHHLGHLQLAVQRPVLRKEAQGFLEAVRSNVNALHPLSGSGTT